MNITQKMVSRYKNLPKWFSDRILSALASYLKVKVNRVSVFLFRPRQDYFHSQIIKLTFRIVSTNPSVVVVIPTKWNEVLVSVPFLLNCL